ncbi:RodZ domain-containing protein [Simiduia agarivorans]|uniref:Cytoskeleton protein RodZ-like C-terminal domain-containing protein n=1 Tax=Simiduia agarivorans (strain DSM 21679 / JCM 13881 / BCRC 17597 / SA1) TaxID=1117647 RepID=K4KW73_SIMAS|nr:RodZ domain-containing protein [Simiduia agarivorans]AFU98147.1 hypothetical protein M5M_04700 [Simiduia agarivorans SA1 = DSM 21679]
MINQNTPEAGDNANPAEALLSPGAALQQARESKSLSLETVANVLRISRAKLQALESDQYADMPAEAFVRGYIRAYCKLVGLDEAEMIGRYEEFLAANREVSQLVESPQVTPAQMFKPVLARFWFVPFILVVLVAGWFWLQPEQARMDENRPAPVSAQVAVPDSAQSSGPDVTVSADGAAPLEDKAPVLPDERPQGVEPAQTQTPVVTRDAVERDPTVIGDVLTVVFSEECWFEVSDAKGDVLAADLKQSGDRVELRGTAPFNVMLGNARAASVVLNGRPVDTTPNGANRALRIQVE